MKRARFVEDAKLDPGRYYRTPFDVIRDRRLTNVDRLEILGAWERALANAPEEQGEKLDLLRRAREEIERSSAGAAPGDPGLETVKPQRS